VAEGVEAVSAVIVAAATLTDAAGDERRRDRAGQRRGKALVLGRAVVGFSGLEYRFAVDSHLTFDVRS
jgi:hypothetical protein